MDSAAPVGLVLNTAVDRVSQYGAKGCRLLNAEALADVERVISTWPGYVPTPLLQLAHVAAAAEVSGVYYKDEGQRFGLGSFKALGGAYAVFRLTERLRAAGVRQLSDITVTCATEGNHGRAVAWAARRVGCSCVIFVHPRVSRAQIMAIRAEGAQVTCVSGNYDTSVREAARAATLNGWHVVSDTSYEGYVDIPRDIMQGYAMIMHEVRQQIGTGAAPSHVFVQAGVGGLAASVGAYLWEYFGQARPRLVIVEPENADCLLRSSVAGARTEVDGELDTRMAGLACGVPSMLAWELLHDCADAFLSIRDQDAVAAQMLLAQPSAGQTAISCGLSGAAGLAGFLAAARDPASRHALHLSQQSVILTIGTEAASE